MVAFEFLIFTTQLYNNVYYEYYYTCYSTQLHESILLIISFNKYQHIANLYDLIACYATNKDKPGIYHD